MTPDFFLTWTHPRRWRQAAWALVLTVLGAAILGGCGGGLDVAGIGSGGSGLAEGTVTGFGSVIVDGQAYDDSQAKIQHDSGPDAQVLASAKLGQRVRVTHLNGAASQIDIRPELRGPVTAFDANTQELQVLGQRVRVVTASTTTLNATVFDGFTQITPGQWLEIHGLWSRDDLGQAILLASRLEQLSTPPSQALLNAWVLSQDGNTLVLDDTQRSVVRASTLPSDVGAGSRVSLWIAASELTHSPTAQTPWQAQTRTDNWSQTSTNTTLEWSGVVDERKESQGLIRVHNVWVFVPTSVAASLPSKGSYLKLQALRQNDQWVATRLETVSARADISLSASIVWPSGTLRPNSLLVRGQNVSTPANAWDSSCQGLIAGQWVYVHIQAQRTQNTSTVVATRIECSSQVPSKAVNEFDGTLVSVQSATQTLWIRQLDTVQGYVWTERSRLPALSTLTPGLGLHVEYQLSNTGEKVIREVEVLDSSDSDKSSDSEKASDD